MRALVRPCGKPFVRRGGGWCRWAWRRSGGFPRGDPIRCQSMGTALGRSVARGRSFPCPMAGGGPPGCQRGFREDSTLGACGGGCLSHRGASGRLGARRRLPLATLSSGAAGAAHPRRLGGSGAFRTRRHYRGRDGDPSRPVKVAPVAGRRRAADPAARVRGSGGGGCAHPLFGWILGASPDGGVGKAGVDAVREKAACARPGRGLGGQPRGGQSG